jgi:hypothetical protein
MRWMMPAVRPSTLLKYARSVIGGSANASPSNRVVYSRYADYKQCPAKFKYKHIERRPDPGSPAMNRGNVIHKAAEDYVKGTVSKIPADLLGVKEQLTFLKAKAVAEENWGFRIDWEWIGRPGWFGDDVWFRAKTDVRQLYEDDTLLLGDWKTGKKYFANEEQIELFALAGYRRFPFVTEVDTRLWYTGCRAPDDNEVQRVYTTKELEAIQKRLDQEGRTYVQGQAVCAYA